MQIIVCSPPGFLFLKHGQRGGSWKNCSEIGGVSWRGDSLTKGDFQIVSSVFLKHVFITTRILVWSIFTLAVINGSILSCGLLFTRKWYIMTFLFLLLLFLNITLWKFYYWWRYFPFHSIKYFKYSLKQITGVWKKRLHNYCT